MVPYWRVHLSSINTITQWAWTEGFAYGLCIWLQGLLSTEMQLIEIQHRLALIQVKCREKKNKGSSTECSSPCALRSPRPQVCISLWGASPCPIQGQRETGGSAAFFSISHPWNISCYGNWKIVEGLGRLLNSVFLIPPEMAAHVLARSYMGCLQKPSKKKICIKKATIQRGQIKTWLSAHILSPLLVYNVEQEWMIYRGSAKEFATFLSVFLFLFLELLDFGFPRA